MYEAEDRLKAVYDPDGLVAAYTYDGDGNRVLELSYDTELKGNLNNKEFTTVNAAEAALEEYLGDEERGLYEITRYINDVNREYTQVLMERDGSGALSTAYVYGNERLSVRSTKKESGYYLYDGSGSVTGIVSILGERLESYGYDLETGEKGEIKTVFIKKRKAVLFLAALFMLFFSACGENQENVLKEEESESATVQREMESASVNSESEFQRKEEDRETEAETTLEAQEEKDGYYRTGIDEVESETLISGDELVDKALSKWSAKGDNDYYLCSESSSRLILEKELTGFSKYELWLIRNEIAARHGCVFEDPILQSYFDTQKWYEPVSGQYETTELNDIEKANLTMIDEVQSREQEPVDYHRFEQLTELKPGKTYEFVYGESIFTLESKKYKNGYIITLNDNGEVVYTHYYYNDDEKVLVCNWENESCLIFSACQGMDFAESKKFLINRDGVKQDLGFNGNVSAYIGNAICTYYQSMGISNYFAYRWVFLQEGEWVEKGKPIMEEHSYKVKRSFACYAVEKDGFSKVTVSPEEMLVLVCVDCRCQDACVYEFKRGGQLVLLPAFSYYEDRSFICEDGAYPWEYFECYGPAG